MKDNLFIYLFLLILIFFSSRLSYQKLDLHKLQLYIDLGRIRTDIPIDVTQIYNIGKFKLDPEEREAGFLLDDEVMFY